MAMNDWVAKLLQSGPAQPEPAQTEPAKPLYGSNASAIKKNRHIADMLMKGAFDVSPVDHPYGAIARIGAGIVGGMKDREADKLQEQRNLNIAQALGADLSPEQLMSMSAQYESPELMQAARFSYDKGRDAKSDERWRQGFDADQAYRGQQQQNWQQGFSADQARDNRNYGLEREKFDWQKNSPPDPTNDMREYDFYSQQEKAAGREPAPFVDYQTSVKRAGATNINNTVGASEPALRKKLSEKEGESWSGYLDSANVSGSTLQDLGALDELLKVAPQGPVAGRLAEMFPGFSTAGDAAQSIMVRVAPTLRTPGSGSTSDVEYQGMLKSLPRLSNSPGGNAMISSVMRAKAQLNVERGQIVAAYQNGQMDDQIARQKLQELNSRSILSPELKAMLGGDVSSAGSSDIDPLLDKYAPVNQ